MSEMSEGIKPPQPMLAPDNGGASGGGGERTIQYKPTWLVEKIDELKDLQANSPFLSKVLARLSKEIGNPERDGDPKYWYDEWKDLERRMEPGTGNAWVERGEKYLHRIESYVVGLLEKQDTPDAKGVTTRSAPKSESDFRTPPSKDVREHQPSWLLVDVDELKNVSPELQTRIKVLHQPALHRGVLTTDDWGKEYKGLLEGLKNEKYKVDEAAPFLARIQEHIQRWDEAERRTERASAAAHYQAGSQQELGSQLEQAHYKAGKRLQEENQPSLEEEYQEFLKNEHYGNSDYKIDRDRNQKPRFLLSRERKGYDEAQINIRERIIRAVGYKRENGAKMEFLANVNQKEGYPLLGLRKTDIAYMYRRSPGVRFAMEFYAKIAHDPNVYVFRRPDNSLFKIYEMRDDGDAEIVRGAVESQVRRILPHDANFIRALQNSGITSREAITRYSRDAEQIAFNLHYLANTWESSLIKWEKGTDGVTRRLWAYDVGGTSHFSNRFLQADIHPLDGLIRDALTQKENGLLGKWAVRQVMKFNAGRGISAEQVSNVQILPETKKDLKRCWTIDRNGTLFVPECYSIKSIGSMFEEARYKVGDRNTSIYDALVNGQDIPWENVGIAEELGSIYVWSMSYESKVLKGYQTTEPKELNEGDFWSAMKKRKYFDSDLDIRKTNLNNWGKVRWVFYTRNAINPEKRVPTFISRGTAINEAKHLRTLISGPFGGRTEREVVKRLLFPWDRPKIRFL